IVVGIHSSVQHETLFFTIADMSEQEIEDLGLKYREEVELEDIVVTYSSIGRNDNYKFYASKLKAKSDTTPIKNDVKSDTKK
ncbi:hypothetical protein SAG0027_07695, partial [Streptococcus agalactiae FSL S3-251]